jgi:hypothetical protein
MKTELIVVVEERADVVVLRRLIARALNLSATFYAGRGRVPLFTLARNLLVHEGGPVLIAMDAHTTHPESVDNARGMTRFVVGLVADESEFHVHAFAPEMDVIFYEAPAVLQRHFGRGITGMELELGRLDPRRQLEQLLAQRGTDRRNFYRLLDNADLDHLLEGPQMQGLIAAADELVSRAGAVHAC